MEDMSFDKLTDMLNSGNIPNDLRNILSSMTNNASTSQTQNSISPEAISNLVNMIKGVNDGNIRTQSCNNNETTGVSFPTNDCNVNSSGHSYDNTNSNGDNR